MNNVHEEVDVNAEDPPIISPIGEPASGGGFDEGTEDHVVFEVIHREDSSLLTVDTLEDDIREFFQEDNGLNKISRVLFPVLSMKILTYRKSSISIQWTRIR